MAAYTDVAVRWAKLVVPFFDFAEAEHSHLDRGGLYALLAGKPDHNALYPDGEAWQWDVPAGGLRYIGLSVDQTLRIRVPQDHSAYKRTARVVRMNPERPDAIVMFGRISSPRRASNDLYEDVECALIFDNQPADNTSCRSRYLRRAIRITNLGESWPLKPKTVLRPTPSR